MKTPAMTSKLSRTAGAIAAAVLAVAAAAAAQTVRGAAGPLMQLPDDPRAWTEKVAPDLMARAAVATGDLDVLIAFRQPAGVQAHTVAAMRAPARLQWIADTDAAVERDWAPGGRQGAATPVARPDRARDRAGRPPPGAGRGPARGRHRLEPQGARARRHRPGVHARERDPAALHRRRRRHRVPRHRRGLDPPRTGPARHQDDRAVRLPRRPVAHRPELRRARQRHLRQGRRRPRHRGRRHRGRHRREPARRSASPPPRRSCRSRFSTAPETRPTPRSRRGSTRCSPASPPATRTTSGPRTSPSAATTPARGAPASRSNRATASPACRS